MIIIEFPLDNFYYRVEAHDGEVKGMYKRAKGVRAKHPITRQELQDAVKQAHVNTIHWPEMLHLKHVKVKGKH